MDDDTMNKVIAHYLPEACGGTSCPAPEIWAAVINEDLPASECEKLDRHASDCPSCAAERALAQQFIFATTLVNVVFWVTLGFISALFFRRLVTPPVAA